MPGSSAPNRSAGSIWKEKKRKNTAAKRSRSGPTRLAARCWTGPDSARPTRKAPMAAETSSSWARPPTRRVSPKTASSSASSEPRSSNPLRWVPNRRATTRITATATRATVTVVSVSPHAEAGDEGRRDGQVDRHGQVLDHQQVQDARRLPVGEAAEVAEDLGDDARRAHPAHPAEQHGGRRVPPEQEPGHESGGEVERRRRSAPGTRPVRRP